MNLMHEPIIVIYHANCPDGFASALAAHLFFKQQLDETSLKEKITYHQGYHGEAPPDCTGKQVYILDFSYKKKPDAAAMPAGRTGHCA